MIDDQYIVRTDIVRTECTSRDILSHVHLVHTVRLRRLREKSVETFLAREEKKKRSLYHKKEDKPDNLN